VIFFFLRVFVVLNLNTVLLVCTYLVYVP